MKTKNTPLKAPHNVIINLTSRCNLSCIHCFGDYSKGNELSIDQWKKIIDDLVKNEVFYVNVTGRQPTKYPYIINF